MTVKINVRAKPYYNGTKILDGNKYFFRFRWNTYTSQWYMDMKGLNNDVEINGTALVCGKELLSSHGYYEIGELRVIDNSGADEDPNFADMGGRFTLEYTPLV